LKGVNELFRSGYRYQKVLIMLLGLVHEDSGQPDFFGVEDNRRKAIMKCFDEVNNRYDSHTLFMGAQGIGKSWSMKREKLSRAYTTDIEGLPEVK